jgi:hypothetical protein
MLRQLIGCLALLCCASLAGAQSTWALTTADFRSQAVTPKQISDAGISAIPAAGGDVITVPYSAFLDISRPCSAEKPAGAFVLHLLGGDQLGGEPAAIQGNSLLWNSPMLGEFPVSLKTIVAITRPGVILPDLRPHDDLVVLSNGDSLHGIVADLAGGKLTIQTDSAATPIPVSSIRQLQFAAAAGATLPEAGFRIRFDDSSSIVALSVRLDGDKLTLALRKNTTAKVDISRVCTIEQLNGPVSWLSSRPTLESVYIPFIGAPRTNAARMDRAWGGQDPIRFGAQQFAHGIGVHSYCRLSWALDGAYGWLRTRYAIDSKDANTRADVTVRILLDDKVVYEQPHVRSGAISDVITQELAGAKKLTLEVDYGDNMDTQDRLNWIEPALVKLKP